MARPADRDQRQMQLAAVVIALAIVLWLGFQWVGRQYGLPGKYAILADFMAIAAMIWSLVVTWRVWRRRKAPSQR